jgi:hypothetical protein
LLGACRRASAFFAAGFFSFAGFFAAIQSP